MVPSCWHQVKESSSEVQEKLMFLAFCHVWPNKNDMQPWTCWPSSDTFKGAKTDIETKKWCDLVFGHKQACSQCYFLVIAVEIYWRMMMLVNGHCFVQLGGVLTHLSVDDPLSMDSQWIVWSKSQCRWLIQLWSVGNRFCHQIQWEHSCSVVICWQRTCLLALLGTLFEHHLWQLKQGMKPFPWMKSCPLRWNPCTSIDLDVSVPCLNWFQISNQVQHVLVQLMAQLILHWL